MNQRSIFAIIGLMTTALIGIVLVQSFWVRSALQLNEEQFDSNVKQAMNAVAVDIETHRALEVYMNLQHAKKDAMLQLLQSNSLPFIHLNFVLSYFNCFI